MRKIQSRAMPDSLVKGLDLDAVQANPELETDTTNLVWDAGQGGWLNARRWAQQKLVGSPGNVTWYFQDAPVLTSIQGGDRQALPQNVFYVVTHITITVVNGGSGTVNMRFRLQEEDPPRNANVTTYLDTRATINAAAAYRESFQLNRALFRPRYHGRFLIIGGDDDVETSTHVHIIWAYPGVQIPV